MGEVWGGGGGVGVCFFFNDTATTEIYTLSLHDALPIWAAVGAGVMAVEGLAVVEELTLLAADSSELLGDAGGVRDGASAASTCEGIR